MQRPQAHKRYIQQRFFLHKVTGAGFTLVEIIIYTAILSIILIAVVTLADIVQTSRARSQILNLVHSTSARVLNTVDMLIRNADGFVSDSGGTKCVFSNKLWLYFGTSSTPFVPSGCMGDYASGALAIEPYSFSGATSTSPDSPRNAKEGYGFAVDSKFMYSVGSLNNGWQISKRFLADMSYETGFGTSGALSTSGNYGARDIAQDGQYLYIVGGYEADATTNSARIEKRRITDGTLVTSFGTEGVVTSTNAKIFKGIAIDSTYLYAVGYKYNSGSSQNDWLVEKRSLSTGLLDTGTPFDTDGFINGFANGMANDIIIDTANNNLYIVGDAGGSRTVEKRLATTGVYVSAFNSIGYRQTAGGTYNSITTDASAVYIAGTDGSDLIVEKITLSNGSLNSSFGSAGKVTAASVTTSGYGVAVDGNYVFTAGHSGNDWYIEKRDKPTGLLVTSFGASGSITDISDTDIPYGGVIADDDYLYILGTTVVSAIRYQYVEKRSRSSGALDKRNGIRMLCYQNYPNRGLASSCTVDPPHSRVSRQDLTDALSLFVGMTDLKLTTTTVGSQLGFEARLRMKYLGSASQFSIATTTASTTSLFRISSP